MGFLTLSGGIGNMSKAIISLWFRVPSAAVAQASGNVSSGDVQIIDGIIPLLIWGPQYDASIYDWTFPEVGPDDCGLSYGYGYVTGSHSSVMPPSFIGVDSALNLFVNIQTPTPPTTGGGVNTEFTGTDAGFIDCTSPVDQACFVTYLRDEIAGTTTGLVPASFGNWVSNGDVNITGGCAFSGLERWHHLLISWDVTDGGACVGSASTSGGPFDNGTYESTAPPFCTASSKMYCAIDTANQTGSSLPAEWVYAFEGTGPGNDVLPSACWRAAGKPEAIEPQTTNYCNFDDNTVYDWGNPQVTVDGGTVSSAPFSIPGPVSLAGSGGEIVCQVEMADLQVWVGQTIDTGDSSKVRLFVTADGFPADPAAAVATFGTPDISLLGQSNWLAGINGGSAGNFTKTGTINPFTPGPSLGA